MVFEKIAGVVTFFTGVGLSYGALYVLLDNVALDFEIFGRNTDLAIMLIAGVGYIYYSSLTRFGKGAIDKSELKRIKKENEGLKLKVEKEKLRNELIAMK